MARSACRVAVLEANLQHATLAVALERYRRQHQDLPEQLDALVPQFIDAIPRDPLDGKPIRYTRNSADSFMLTSMGDTGIPNACEVSDVWVSTPPVRQGRRLTAPKGENIVLWYGLAPESNPTIKTALR